jgi:hypothetical protein
MLAGSMQIRLTGLTSISILGLLHQCFRLFFISGRKDVPISATFVKTRNGKKDCPFGHLIDETILEIICASAVATCWKGGNQFLITTPIGE